MRAKATLTSGSCDSLVEQSIMSISRSWETSPLKTPSSAEFFPDISRGPFVRTSSTRTASVTLAPVCETEPETSSSSAGTHTTTWYHPSGQVSAYGETSTSEEEEMMSSEEELHGMRESVGAVAMPETNEIRVSFGDEELWEKFDALTNEMVVASGGRHMFPSIKLNIEGLDPDQLYMVWVHFETVGSAGVWQWDSEAAKWRSRPAPYPSPKAPRGAKRQHARTTPGPSIPHTRTIYNHPASPSPGAFWMNQLVGFDALKLATPQPENKHSADNIVVLQPGCKYMPVVYVAPYVSDTIPSDMGVSVQRFPLEVCTFIATPAHCNSEVAKLKILANPAAKARLLQRLAGPAPVGSNAQLRENLRACLTSASSPSVPK